MVRVVLDTNIVVSAALKPGGNERAAMEEIRMSGSPIVASRALLAEYDLVLARRKFRHVRNELGDLVATIRASAFLVEPVAVPRICRDPADDMVLACAEAAAAEFLITGNLRDFPATWRGTRIVNARTFLAGLARQPGGA